MEKDTGTVMASRKVDIIHILGRQRGTGKSREKMPLVHTHMCVTHLPENTL